MDDEAQSEIAADDGCRRGGQDPGDVLRPVLEQHYDCHRTEHLGGDLKERDGEVTLKPHQDAAIGVRREFECDHDGRYQEQACGPSCGTSAW